MCLTFFVLPSVLPTIFYFGLVKLLLNFLAVIRVWLSLPSSFEERRQKKEEANRSREPKTGMPSKKTASSRDSITFSFYVPAADPGGPWGDGHEPIRYNAPTNGSVSR
jgi:hypothetical protein